MKRYRATVQVEFAIDESKPARRTDPPATLRAALQQASIFLADQYPALHDADEGTVHVLSAWSSITEIHQS